MHMTFLPVFDLAPVDLVLSSVPADTEVGFRAADAITSELGLGSAQLTLATAESGARAYIA